MSRIAIGSDHAGFDLKQHFVGVLQQLGHVVHDLGTHSTESCDYPPICAAVGRAVRDGDAELGIVIGGSGQGEQLAANKVHGVRAALCNDLYLSLIHISEPTRLLSNSYAGFCLKKKMIKNK